MFKKISVNKMFFTSALQIMYRVRPKADRWWKVQKMKEDARHFWFRSIRARYGLAKIHVRRSYIYQTQARVVRPFIRNKLRQCRLDASCKELDITRPILRQGLKLSGVKLNSEMLIKLAMYEPRTFERLVELAQRSQIEKIYAQNIKLPDRCFTKIPPNDELKYYKS